MSQTWYKTARIYEARSFNAGHISNPKFSDEELGKPHPPINPQPTHVELWQPISWTVVLIIIAFGLPIILLALAGIWLWVFFVDYPEYIKKKQKSDSDYKRAMTEYEVNLQEYQTTIIPKWEQQRPYILKQKQEEWRKLSIDYVCQEKTWRVCSTKEIEQTQKDGFIGPGELELFQALLNSNVLVRHQVEIQPYYTADIVCFNPDSGKLCIVEVDGSQHWLDPEQIKRDNRRMHSLALNGVPTIRFVNMFARSHPRTCVKHIEQLLS